MYKVKILKRAIKRIEKMPIRIQKSFKNLLEDLEEKGPIRTDWPNYSKLDENTYHCHLARKWVACWQWEKESIVIEVYYAGSRENAPY